MDVLIYKLVQSPCNAWNNIYLKTKYFRIFYGKERKSELIKIICGIVLDSIFNLNFYDADV